MHQATDRERLFAPLLADLKISFRGNTSEASIGKPKEFVKEGPDGQAIVEPYEKHKFSRYPKQHMTDEILKAMLQIAQVIGDNIGAYEANAFYRQCWYSQNAVDLDRRLTPWLDRLKILGLLT
jgi:hypothetical protein